MNHPRYIRLKKASIDEFKTIYEKKHGRKITDDEADEMAHRVLRVFSVLLRIGPTETDSQGVRTASRLTESEGAPYDTRA